MKKIWKYILIIGLMSTFGSCKKYLEEKPKQSLYVPSKYEDLQALFDDSFKMNMFNYGNSLIELVSDDYYVTFDDWQSTDFKDQQAYIWSNQAYDYQNWSLPYTSIIYTSNVVLDQLDKIKTDDNVTLKSSIEGAALFFRSAAFFQLAQVYCKPYSNTAQNDLGIVLTQTSAAKQELKRATVAETYTKIISDLNRAGELLPEHSNYVTRPDKSAAFAMLARVFLAMRDYENALKFSDMSLSLNNTLLDFNTLMLNNPPSIPWYTSNPEVIFFSTLNGSNLTQPFVAKIDSNLYKSYSDKDIRKSLFFLENDIPNKGTYAFNGSYYFASIVFNGLSTAELYLIKAECLARKENTIEAMKILNSLLKNRYQKGQFNDFVAVNATEAKRIILTERRKELLFRGLRWSDLRRLNLEGENITLKRILNGVTYTLSPNDPRWVMLIPIEEIERSGIPQNIR